MSGVETLPVPMTPMRPGINGQSSPLVSGVFNNHRGCDLMCTKNKKGFILAKLLIVVAIIGVLVAISIPIFSSQLEKSRVATDQANVRSAKAAAAAEYMGNGESGSVSYVYNDGSVTKIDLTNTMNLDKRVSESGYGKSTKEDADGSITGATGRPKDSVVEVTIDGSDITAQWIDCCPMIPLRRH
jgi:Tfp pilus assembly protein PilE